MNKLKKSDYEIILGITTNRKLTFNKHFKNLCKKAGQKLCALLRISPYLDENKKKLLYCSMTKSQFNYCPLVWMFLSRKANNLIYEVQERALRLITNDYQSSFNILLDMCNEFSIHQRNLQTLVIELYKIVHQIAPPIMNSLFVFRENVWTSSIIRFYQIVWGRHLHMVWKLFYIDPRSLRAKYRFYLNKENKKFLTLFSKNS